MILLKQVKVLVSDQPKQALKNKILKELKLQKDEVLSMEILRQSVDARKKQELFYVYNVALKLRDKENLILKRKYKFSVEPYEKIPFEIPFVSDKHHEKIAVIGAGPAGLFCAYYLALAGFKPVLLEQGKKVEERKADVEEFWNNGKLFKEV